MSNVNTFAGLYNLPAFANPTAESAVPLVSGGLVRAVVGVRADIAGGLIDGREFRVRAVGAVTGGTTTNFTLKLYANLGGNTNLTTFTNDTAICTSGAFAVNSTTKPFIVEADCIWDSVSKTLNGNFFVQAANTFTAPAALSSQGTSIASASSLQFFATALFSASNAGNSVLVNELSIEQV